MEDERVELEADVEKLQTTLEEDGNQCQYAYMVDSEDDSDDEEDTLFVDLGKGGSGTASVASVSLHSAGGRTTPSAQSIGSHPTTESVITEQDDDADLFREVGVVLEKLDSSASLPATLESCLVINHAYQDIICEHISRIELELAENRETQRRLEEEAKESSKQQVAKKRFPYSMNLPYFKMRYGSTPAENEDVRLKRMAQEPDLDIRPEPKWNLRHKRWLIEAVTDDSSEKLLGPLLNRLELEQEKLKNVEPNSEGYENIQSKIALISKEIEEKKNTPQEQLLLKVDPERVDWMKISNMKFDGKRDWMACQRAWIYQVDPRLNQSALTPEEEQRLANLISETDGMNWVYIAQQLGTGRTAFQCLQYYQQNVNQELTQRPWTNEEDKQLLEVVEKCQQYHFNWNNVSQFMEGRSGLQCYKRFSKVDPTINKGFWTEAEDAQLMAAVQLVGTTHWGRVQELVPGRTREQCRERYVNSLDPKISGKRWTYEEDRTIVQLVKKYGPGNWVKLCQHLPGRTDNQILQRYRRLEDWKKKHDWFISQSPENRELLQGNNLPLALRQKTQNRNWEQFKTKLGVYPDDYTKQSQDMEHGLFVPRPPIMIGLANKSGNRVWDRRFELHRLIESHIDKVRDKYNLTPSVTGVFELQDAITQLSRDCIAQRDQLLNRRRDYLGQVIHTNPCMLSVRDLLKVSRGEEVPLRMRRERTVRRRSRPMQTISARLHRSMQIESELKKVARSTLKGPSFKRGRPRRFFWDIDGYQKLSDKDMQSLKATTMNLYFKSLGVDPAQLVVEGRKTFPQVYHQLCDQHCSCSSQPEEEEEEDTKRVELPPPETPKEDQQQPVRRSQRARKRKMVEEAEVKPVKKTPDPFTLDGQPDECSFSQWQKQRDYELLEWLARMEDDVTVDYEPPPQLSADEEIPTVGTVEVKTAPPGMSPEKVGEGAWGCGRPPIGHGMSLVHASIQQALQESEADGRGENGSHGHQHDATSHSSRNTGPPPPSSSSSATVTTDSLRSGNVAVGSNSSCTCDADAVPGPSSAGATPGAGVSQPYGRRVKDPCQDLPSLPPTATSLHSFKQLLLRRLGLIKKAGGYYNISYYLQKKDRQLAELIQAGNTVQELNRGIIDLSRMMNRVAQETDSSLGKKRSNSSAQPAQEPIIEADHRDLEAIRQTEDYRALEARFQAVFSWPALLSTVYPPFQRKQFKDKAGPSFHPKDPDDDNASRYKSVRKRMPLLKSRGFYKYANKTKAEKEAILKKQRDRRILKQVQQLMADEDDPMPEVTLEPDSDDEEMFGSKARESSAATSSTNNGSVAAVAGPSGLKQGEGMKTQKTAPSKAGSRKQYRRRDRGAQPVRQSARSMQRKTYSDSIYRKQLDPAVDGRVLRWQKQRQPESPRPPSPPEPAQQPLKTRAVWQTKYMRRVMLDAMVTMGKKPHTPAALVRQQRAAMAWMNPGGYESDEDGGMMEMEGDNWVENLTQDQRYSLAVLERESIVERTAHHPTAPVPVPATATSAGDLEPGISLDGGRGVDDAVTLELDSDDEPSVAMMLAARQQQ